MPLLTSIEAARELFGQDRFIEYLTWKRSIDNPEESVFYESKEQWQAIIQIVRASYFYDFPTPCMYRLFMEYLRSSGELFEISEDLPCSSLNTASWCRHPLHPGFEIQDTENCPMCVAEQTVGCLIRIWRLWHLLGGPKIEVFDSEEHKVMWSRTKSIYRVEKIRWANIVYKFEKHAESERKWEDEAAHSSYPEWDDLLDVMSAQDALDFMFERSPNMAEGPHIPFEPSERGINIRPILQSELAHLVEEERTYSPFPSSQPAIQLLDAFSSPTLAIEETFLPALPELSPRQPRFPSLSTLILSSDVLQLPPSPLLQSLPAPSVSESERSLLPSSPPSTLLLSTKGKKVVLLEDIPEYEHRNSVYFQRTSPYYKPGRHACPSKDGWVNTSSWNADDEFDYVCDSDSDSYSDSSSDEDMDSGDSSHDSKTRQAASVNIQNDLSGQGQLYSVSEGDIDDLEFQENLNPEIKSHHKTEGEGVRDTSHSISSGFECNKEGADAIRDNNWDLEEGEIGESFDTRLERWEPEDFVNTALDNCDRPWAEVKRRRIE